MAVKYAVVVPSLLTIAKVVTLLCIYKVPDPTAPEESTENLYVSPDTTFIV